MPNRLQINLANPSQPGEYPFMDLTKGSQLWGKLSANVAFPPDELDENGYPNSAGLATDHGVSACWVPSQTHRSGRYVLRAYGVDGSQVGVGLVQGDPSGSYTVVDGVARYEFQPELGDGPINAPLYINMGAGRHITKYQLFHIDDEDDIDEGLVFSTAFKNRIIEGGVKRVRCMDWWNTNGTNITEFSEMSPVDAYSYTGLLMLPGTWAGETTNVGDVYSAALPGFVLVDKAKVAVRWGADAASDTIFLNVNNTGNVPIRTKEGVKPALNPPFFVFEWPEAGRYGTFVYDAALGAFVGDTNTGAPGFGRGVPPPLVVQLCNELGVDPWVNIPYLAVDPMTNFTFDLATYLKNNLTTPGAKPVYEVVNEIWNNFLGFPHTRYGREKEKLRNGGADFDEHQWYGRALSKVGQVVSDVYDNDRTKYDVVCGFQLTYVPASASTARLTCPRYVTETGNASDAAHNWVTAFSPSSYWDIGYSQHDSLAERQATVAAWLAETDEAAKLAILQSVAADDTLDVPTVGNFARFDDYAALCATYGITRFLPYEGAMSTDAFFFSADGIEFCRALKGVLLNEVVGRTLKAYHKIVSLGGGMPSVFPMAVENDPRWPAMRTVYQTDVTSEWEAIKLFKAGKLRLIVK
jgi:hypothetical protein